MKKARNHRQVPTVVRVVCDVHVVMYVAFALLLTLSVSLTFVQQIASSRIAPAHNHAQEVIGEWFYFTGESDKEITWLNAYRPDAQELFTVDYYDEQHVDSIVCVCYVLDEKTFNAYVI